MPYKEKEIERRYWTIGQVANQLGIATSMIRSWEPVFNSKPSKKWRKNEDRRYNRREFEYVKNIHYLLKVKGFTHKGALKQIEDEQANRANRKQSLQNIGADVSTMAKRARSKASRLWGFIFRMA